MMQRLDSRQEDLLRAKLEDSERQSMRSSLMSYMENNPVRESVAQQHVPRSRSKNFLPIFLLVLSLLMILGAGISHAAENAVPGDPLYSVKLDVNDHIASLFALSDKSKVHVDLALANQRLDEATVLAAESKLTPAVQASLTQDLEQHVESIETDIAHLQSNHDMQDAEIANQEFESSLEAHATVIPLLFGISQQGTSSTSTIKSQ